jgi:prepilin-type N-terminal cleavage/methylation domain-containing protein
MRELTKRNAPRGSDGRRTRRAASGDEGFSLVEVVITIVLISVVIIPIIQATFTSVKASSTARIAAEVDTTLQNAADRVTRAGTLCEYSPYIKAALIAKGWDPNHVTWSYQYYVPGANATVDGTWVNGVDGACPAGGRTPRLIQKVTITVTSDMGSIQRTIQVVKSDV